MPEQVQVALIGLSGVIIGVFLSGLFQMRGERFQLKKSREESVAREFSNALQQLTIRMASSVHSMCWLTWLASADESRISQSHLDNFDAEQHRILPEIIGYAGTVAALDAKVYEELAPYIRKIYYLDARIADAGLLIAKNRTDSVSRLAAFWEEANELERDLPAIVGDIVRQNFRLPTPIVSRTRAKKRENER
jgi:hypothetical protein